MKNLNDRRRLAVRLRTEGASISDARKATGLSRSTVIRAFNAHKHGRAVDVVRSGRPPGSGRKLTALQEAQVRKWIHAGSPEVLGLPQALWTQRAVRQVIQDKFGVVLADRTVALYLKRWGLAFKHPFKLTRGWTEDATPGDWYRECCPPDAQTAHKAGAQLLWCDWQSVPAAPGAGDTVSKRPGSATTRGSARERIALYAMTQSHVGSWMCYDRLNSASCIDFFDALGRSSIGEILLILVESRIPVKVPVP